MGDLNRRDQATIERAKRLLAGRLASGSVDLASPRDLENFLLVQLDGLADEHSICLALDDASRLLDFRVWSGDLRRCEMRPRQIAALALAVNATKIIVGHSHPASICCPTPSEQDVESTHRLRTILGWLDLQLLDSYLIAVGAVHSVDMSDAAASVAQAGILNGDLRDRLADIVQCLSAASPALGRLQTPARILIEHATRLANGT
ncbi:MAG: hypothetical protein J0M13_10930 [Candidatus Accumulibacter sp.]|jgi:DNA repair protein RadC|nr:hypothetical protein [Candidatus Accumulibacter necessarius]